jgi:hypothetical protein
MAVSMIGPKFYAWDRNGNPLAFGKLYTYQSSTNVPKPTYQTEDQIVPNTNPVILNGEGYADIYLDGSYKMVLKDENENEIWTSDPVTSSQANEWIACYSASYVSPTEFSVIGNVTSQYEPGKKVRLNSNQINFDYSTIESSVFSGGQTNVTVIGGVVKTGLISVCASVVGQSSSFSKNDLELLTILYAETVDDAINGRTIGGETVEVKLGQRWAVDNYSDKSISGTLFFRVIESGVNSSDGGKWIDVPGGVLQFEQNLKLPYNAKAWGQVGDKIEDDTIPVTNALIYARNSGRLVINGTSLMTSPLTFASEDRGMFIEGDGSQSYGEFNTGKPSTLYFSNLTSGEFMLTLESIFPFRMDGINIESDDWTVNGIKTTAPTRELILNDVSIKGVDVGLEAHDTYVVRGENVGITARSKGISWGGGTTLQLENLKLQGDKTNGIRLDRGIEFVFDSEQSDSPVMPNVTISGFCQYSNTVVYTDNSSCQVELDSFDVEDNVFAVIWLRNQYKGFYRIRNSSLLIGDNSSVVVIGEGNQYVTIDICDPLMKDKHMILKDWSTEKFINTETSNIGSNIEIVLNEQTFNRVKSGIVATAMPRVKVTRAPFAQDPDCIMQVGSGTIPEDYVNRLWRNKQLYDATNDETFYYGAKSSEFSNGMIYRITSQNTATNDPIVAYFTLRTADGSQYFNLTNVIGTMPLTYDDVNDELVFTAATPNQRFIITCG